MMENNQEYIIELYDLYGSLLTNKQKDMFEKYYFYNLSLTEISEEVNVSRTAVSDALSHAVNNLIDYENKLNLFKKVKKIKNLDIPKEYIDKILEELK